MNNSISEKIKRAIELDKLSTEFCNKLKTEFTSHYRNDSLCYISLIYNNSRGGFFVTLFFDNDETARNEKVNEIEIDNILNKVSAKIEGHEKFKEKFYIDFSSKQTIDRDYAGAYSNYFR